MELFLIQQRGIHRTPHHCMNPIRTGGTTQSLRNRGGFRRRLLLLGEDNRQRTQGLKIEFEKPAQQEMTAKRASVRIPIQRQHRHHHHNLLAEQHRRHQQILLQQRRFQQLLQHKHRSQRRVREQLSGAELKPNQTTAVTEHGTAARRAIPAAATDPDKIFS